MRSIVIPVPAIARSAARLSYGRAARATQPDRAWYADDDGDLFGDAGDTSPVISCAPVAGHVPNARDCDDTDVSVSPIATEHCDGADEDCDTRVDERTFPTFCADADLDRHGDPGVL